MGLLNRFFDWLASTLWERGRGIRRQRAEVNEAPSLLSTQPPSRSTETTRTFAIKEAINGQYIEYVRHKWNPNGPDEYSHHVYLVHSGESVHDAIAAVLVLMETQKE